MDAKTAAIAQHLQIEVNQIKEVRNFKCWNGGEVFLVLFVKGRSRFVSKKVAEVMISRAEAEAMIGMPIKGWDEKSGEFISKLAEAGYKNDTITPRQRMDFPMIGEIESHYGMDCRTISRLAMVAAMLNGQSLEFVRGY